MPLEKSVEVFAELYYKDNSLAPVVPYLLGTDGNIYTYNDVWHMVRPFSQKATKKQNISKERIEYILDRSIIEYADGSKEIGKKVTEGQNDGRLESKIQNGRPSKS